MHRLAMVLGYRLPVSHPASLECSLDPTHRQRGLAGEATRVFPEPSYGKADRMSSRVQPGVPVERIPRFAAPEALLQQQHHSTREAANG